MDKQKEQNKIPELSAQAFMNNCQVVNIEDMINTNDIGNSSIKEDIEIIKKGNKNNK